MRTAAIGNSRRISVYIDLSLYKPATVISTLALSLASGLSILDAAILSNIAAGIVDGKLGTASVRPEELTSAIDCLQGSGFPISNGKRGTGNGEPHLFYLPENLIRSDSLNAEVPAAGFLYRGGSGRRCVSDTRASCPAVARASA